MAWMSTHPDDPIPDQFQQYNQPMLDALREGTKQGRAYVEAQRKQVRDDDLEEQRKNRDAHQDFRDAQEERRTAVMEARSARMEQASGTKAKVVAEPTKEGIALAESMIKNEYSDLTPDLEISKGTFTSQAALAVAARAKGKMAANPGMTLDEASSQAFLEAKQNGEFSQVVTKKKFLGIPVGDDTKTKFTPGGGSGGGGGGTAQAPLALPADRNLQKGKFYNTPKGVVQWDGSKAIPVVGGVGG